MPKSPIENSKMNRENPFAPVPVSPRARPIVVRRDQRAVDLEYHLAEGKTSSKLNDRAVQVRGILIVLAICLALIVGRIGYLQIARGEVYRTSAEKNRIRLEVIHAPRGIIFDRNQQPLLENVPNF